VLGYLDLATAASAYSVQLALKVIGFNGWLSKHFLFQAVYI
jgi:hypothetical protein